MQVADVLGDTDHGSWLDMLVQRVKYTQWRDADSANDMLCALLTLPPHLLHRCLVLWLSASGEPLHTLLATCPMPLQQPLIAAAASDGTLSVVAPANHVLFSLLSTTVVPAPGLRSLSVTSPGGADSPMHPVPAVHAVLLARVLAAHPSITHLALSTVRLNPPALKRFTACIPHGALPQLVCLSIYTAVHPGGCAALAGCLQRLSALTQLSVRLKQNDGAVAPSLDDFLHAAASPVCLPRILHLTLIEHRQRTTDNAGSHESARGTESWLPFFLRLIAAPMLSTLKIVSRVPTSHLSVLWSTIGDLPTLRSVVLNATASEAPPLFGGHACTLRPAPLLTDVELKSANPVTPLLAASYAAAVAPGATSLVLKGGHGTAQEFLWIGATDEAWAAMLASMGRFTQLQRLHLGVLSGACNSPDLTDALQQLTTLTCLALQSVQVVSYRSDPHCHLQGQPLGGALAALTALETLHICNGAATVTVEQAKHVLHACTRLTRLSHLGLCMHTEQDLSSRIRRAIPRMRSLKHLQVGVGVSLRMQASADAKIESLRTQFPEVTVDICGCTRVL